MPRVAFRRLRTLGKALQQGFDLRGAMHLQRLETITLLQAPQPERVKDRLEGAFGHQRLPGGKLTLHPVKEQRAAGNAKLPGPRSILRAERIEQRFLDAIFVEKRDA